MSQRIALRFYQDDRHRPPLCVSLPEMTGQHELSIKGVDTQSAIGLLSQLLKEDAHGIKVEQLTASDRDSLLVGLHRECWGDKIISSLHCEDCDEFFDLSFTLSELQRHLFSENSDVVVVKNATIQISDCNPSAEIDIEQPMTIPVSSQETILGTLPDSEAMNQLREWCKASAKNSNEIRSENTLLESELSEMSVTDEKMSLTDEKISLTDETMELIAEQLERIAPIIDLELDATCPDCGKQHQASFDIQSFVLQRLLNEKDNLLAEMHLIAMSYGWSLNEILSLPRSTRKSITGLIEQGL